MTFEHNPDGVPDRVDNSARFELEAEIADQKEAEADVLATIKPDDEGLFDMTHLKAEEIIPRGGLCTIKRMKQAKIEQRVGGVWLPPDKNGNKFDVARMIRVGRGSCNETEVAFDTDDLQSGDLVLIAASQEQMTAAGPATAENSIRLKVAEGVEIELLNQADILAILQDVDSK